MSERQSDPEAITARLRQGDVEALGLLLQQERPRLLGMIRFRMDPRLRGRIDEDDILQEVFVAAESRIAHFGGDNFACPVVWLRLIVRQVLIDLYRRHLGAQARDARRESPIHGRNDCDTSRSMAIQLVHSATSPSGRIGRQEKLEQVTAAIEAMEPIDREVLALRHFEELTNSETAEALEITAKAASIRYVRALQRLRQMMADRPEWFEGSAHA